MGRADEWQYKHADNFNYISGWFLHGLLFYNLHKALVARGRASLAERYIIVVCAGRVSAKVEVVLVVSLAVDETPGRVEQAHVRPVVVAHVQDPEAGQAVVIKHHQVHDPGGIDGWNRRSGPRGVVAAVCGGIGQEPDEKRVGAEAVMVGLAHRVAVPAAAGGGRRVENEGRVGTPGVVQVKKEGSGVLNRHRIHDGWIHPEARLQVTIGQSRRTFGRHAQERKIAEGVPLLGMGDAETA